MLKLYSTHYYPELQEQFAIAGYVLPIAHFSDHTDILYTVQDLEGLIKKLQNSEQKVYAWLNRFFFDDEIDAFKQVLVDLHDIGIDGIVYMDLGISKLLDELEIEIERIYLSDPSITNSKDYEIIQNFNDKVMLSRELTLDELLEIGQLNPQSAMVSIYGHQLMSISRRPLLSSYGEFVDLEVSRHKIYRLKEKNRQDPYYLFEDDTSTSIFDGRVLVDFEGLEQFRAVGMHHFLIEGFNRRKEELIAVTQLSAQIYHQNLSIEQAKQEFQQQFPDTETTQGLRQTKTSDRKVNV